MELFSIRACIMKLCVSVDPQIVFEELFEHKFYVDACLNKKHLVSVFMLYLINLLHFTPVVKKRVSS